MKFPPEPPEDDRTRLERALREHAPVVDPAGERLGELDAVYYDDRTGEPSWLEGPVAWSLRTASANAATWSGSRISAARR